MGRGLTFVIDASALLAVLLEERGAEVVIPVLRGSAISAINFSESMVRAIDKGHPSRIVAELVDSFDLEIVAFDRSHANIAADLRTHTRSIGASFGDRACLALALQRQVPVLTADTDWSKLDPGLGIDIRQIR